VRDEPLVRSNNRRCAGRIPPPPVTARESTCYSVDGPGRPMLTVHGISDPWRSTDNTVCGMATAGLRGAIRARGRRRLPSLHRRHLQQWRPCRIFPRRRRPSKPMDGSERKAAAHSRPSTVKSVLAAGSSRRCCAASLTARWAPAPLVSPLARAAEPREGGSLFRCTLAPEPDPLRPCGQRLAGPAGQRLEGCPEELRSGLGAHSG